MEELTIKKIECGIRGIRFGTKSPQESRVDYFLNKLQDMDSLWYEDYLIKYEKAKKHYNRNKK